MDTWAGVVRISHMGARKAGDANVHADRDQLAAIEQHARAHGATLVVLDPELDVSGGLPLEQRPSLLRAIEGVERGEFNGVIVAYLSRFGRSVREQLAAWDRIEAAGGRVIVVQEGIDTSTPSGRLHRNVLLSIAEHERELHAERFGNLRRWATDAGIWQRRQTPLGYRRNPQTRKLEPDVDARRVQRAFVLRGAGSSISAIADDLGMTPGGARQLLRNRVYLGELRVGEHVNPAAHEPLVTIDVFEAAQISVPRPGRNVDRAPALLAGLARCAGCGHVMSRQTTARVVYSCARRHSGGQCPEPAAVTAALLDAHVETIALAELERLRISTSERGSLDDARAALAAAERELNAFVSAVSAADIGAAAFGAGARQRQDAVDAARERLRVQLAAQPVVPDVGSGADVWQQLDGHARNALLRALLEAVVVRRGGGRGSRTPLAERVRVIAYGAGLVNGRRTDPNAARTITALPFLDLDDERVLRVAGS
jgi:DNA invertase Pin-like site-specific DNA recombinase